MQSRAHIAILGLASLGVLLAALAFATFPLASAWLLVASLPVALIGALAIHLVIPSDAKGPSARHTIQVPYDPSDAAARRDPGRPDGDEPGSLDGVWTGTVRVRRVGRSDECLPLRLMLSTTPPSSRLLPVDCPAPSDGVTDVQVLEHDERHGHVFLRVALESDGAPFGDELVAALSCGPNELTSVDDTGRCAVELRRADADLI